MLGIYFDIIDVVVKRDPESHEIEAIKESNAKSFSSLKFEGPSRLA